MAEKKWTAEQLQVIEDRGANLLVSASAGSGKTTVMIERIVQLMVQENIPLTDFLVVTFTKASALDMKKKLEDRLIKLPQTEFVREQIENIAISDISDLHSFCSKLISTYFYVVGLDPAIKIIDPTHAESLKFRELTKLFSQKEKDGDVEFFRLYDIFQKRRKDNGLREAILKFSEFLNSQLAGEQWLAESLEKSYEPNIEQNICAKQIFDYVKKRVSKMAKRAENFARRCFDFDEQKLGVHFNEIASNFVLVSKQTTYEGLAKQVLEFKFSRSPSPSKDKGFLGEEAKDLKEKLKKEIENFGKNLISPDSEVLASTMERSKQTILSLFKLTKQFNENFAEAKHDLGCLDFNDLEKYALKVLDNPEVLLRVKEKYKYVFVDEYQDINEVQEKILSLVSGKQNRFMVGDIKQSIYRFRLCDPEIFLQKYKIYGKDGITSKVIKLNANFRSDKKILSFVDEIFSGVMTEDFGEIDYQSDSKFVAGEDNYDQPKALNLCYIDTQGDDADKTLASGVYSVKNHTENSTEAKTIEAEANLVASKISTLIGKENFKYSQIAILVFARNKQIKSFISHLKSFGIPVSSDEKYNLFDQISVLEVLNLIKLCINENDDILLFKVLKSRFFTFSDLDLIKIRSELNSSEGSKINPQSLFEQLLSQMQSTDQEIAEKIKHFVDEFASIRRLILTMSIKDASEFVIEKFKLFEINLLEENGERANDDLNKFLALLPNCSVQEFVIDFEGLKLEMEGECGGDNISIMTVHKSKGIEFDVVFLVNLFAKINLSSTNGDLLFSKKLGVGCYDFDTDERVKNPTIPHRAIQMIERRKIVEEQQRVLYVALTRAKQKMFLICSKEMSSLSGEFPERPTNYINWFERIILNELSSKHNGNINFEKYSLSELFAKTENQRPELLLTFDENESFKPFEYEFSTSENIPLKSSVSKILMAHELGQKLSAEENQTEKNDDNQTQIIDKIQSEINGEIPAEKNSKIQNKINDENQAEAVWGSASTFDKIQIDSELDFSGDERFYEDDFGESQDSGSAKKSTADRGTTYHKFFEKFEFNENKPLDERVEEALLKLTPAEREIISKPSVTWALSQPIFSEISRQERVLKEREFFAKVSAKLISSFASDGETFVLQGVIDLLAISGDSIILLDYKTGKFTEEKLKKYRFQIEAYAEVAMRVFGAKSAKKYLCFVDSKKIIEI